MTRYGILAALLVSTAGTAAEQHQSPAVAVTPLMTKALAQYPGKEVLMLTVDYPPGGSDPVHRHDAHAFVYVLQGSIVMGVRGAQPVTLKAGQTFYEGPEDVHTIGRNASATKPARFVVFLIKESDAPVFTPSE